MSKAREFWIAKRDESWVASVQDTPPESTKSVYGSRFFSVVKTEDYTQLLEQAEAMSEALENLMQVSDHEWAEAESCQMCDAIRANDAYRKLKGEKNE